MFFEWKSTFTIFLKQYISNTYVFIFRLFRFLNNFIELFTLWVGYSKKSERVVWCLLLLWLNTIKQINWNFINESKPIHLGPLETKAYTTNGARTIYKFIQSNLIIPTLPSPIHSGINIWISWINLSILPAQGKLT